MASAEGMVSIEEEVAPRVAIDERQPEPRMA
jgi:hypothetical protein